MSEPLFSSLFGLTGQSKKLICNEAFKEILLLSQKTSHTIRYLPQILTGLNEKNAFVRETGAHLFLCLLYSFKIKKYKKESCEKFEIVEKCLIKGLEDSNPKVRTICRDSFYIYKELKESKAKA